MTAPPFHWHVLVLVVLGGAAWAVRRAPSWHYRVRGIVAGLAFAACTLWPIGDLAASVSLSVATAQRLVLMLLVAPLAMLATPTAQWVTMTRPRVLDAVARTLVRPLPAVVVVTVVGTATLSVPVVNAAAGSTWIRDAVVLVVVLLGVILWLPVLRVVPGARRLSELARAAYLFVSSIVVTSLSLVWIFARHPLYQGLRGQRRYLHLSALADQQIAGFVAKLGAYAVLWTVAFVIFSRADRGRGALEDSPLYWADVERELLRERRARVRHPRGRDL